MYHKSFKPKYHEVVSERVIYTGNIEYTLRYNPELFKHARCKDIDTELFFPVQDKFTAEEERYLTQNLCGGCPVKEACLEWAIVHERFGVWGGTTAHRRSLIRKQHGIAFNEISLPSTKR